MDPIRLKKAEELRASGMTPYAATFPRSHRLAQARNAPDDTNVSVAGRVMLLRDMGKMTFATLQDETGRLQIAFKKNEMPEGKYETALAFIDLGDFIGVGGTRFATKTGEPTVLVKDWMMLSKTLRQPPEKWHGIADQETSWRQRYLDLLSNRETLERFQKRSLFLKLLREFYWSKDFVEVETPVLVNAASGALAKPFVTHHEAYDMDVFLRIAPETYLKECLVGGFDRVFEVARCFRNEGLDPSHLQDFTMVEHYASYWDYTHNMAFTEELFSTILKELLGTLKLSIHDREGKLQEVDFTPPWPKVSIRDSIKGSCQIDINEFDSKGALVEAINKKHLRLEVDLEDLSFGSIIDQLYKKVSRPKILGPLFLTEHPIELSPLARKNDANSRLTDRFQLVIGGWEIVNAYSELIDPVDQNKRFEDQSKSAAAGDSEAHRKDDDFVKALEYGCPPCSGWGMGVDRFVALITQQTNLRDMVLFPLMKPMEVRGVPPGTDAKTAKKGTTKSLPSQASTYAHLLPAAHTLLMKHADKTRAHLLATGAVMEKLASRFNGDPATWKVVGYLHDLDWDHLEKDLEQHCGTTLEQLLSEIGSPKELLEDIRSHYAEKYGDAHPLDSWLRRSLYAVDELTGFIIAVTLVRPSKKLADVEVSSVKKKLKDKTFAAQVSREQIKKCEELLSIPLDEFISLALDAMKSVATDLGL